MVNFSSAGNQALNQLNNLPFDNIIGGPLSAAITAQAQAAETTVDFIQRVGMQEVNGQKEAINVQFLYEDASGQSRRITVPILAIVPIPFIVIDNVNIAFKAKITASAASNASQSKSSAGYVRASVGYRGAMVRANLSAGYSAKKDSKASQESKYSVEYTMDVQVNASQAGLPAGMEAVLGFLQQGTHELPVSTQARIIGMSPLFAIQAAGTFDPTTAPAPSFNVVVTDANDQPMTALASGVATLPNVTITSENGFVEIDSFEDGTGDAINDGMYKVTLKPGPNLTGLLPLQAGDDLVDEITVTVETAGGTTTATRAINLRAIT